MLENIVVNDIQNDIQNVINKNEYFFEHFIEHLFEHLFENFLFYITVMIFIVTVSLLISICIVCKRYSENDRKIMLDYLFSLGTVKTKSVVDDIELRGSNVPKKSRISRVTRKFSDIVKRRKRFTEYSSKIEH